MLDYRKISAYYFAVEEAARLLYVLTGQQPEETRRRLLNCGLEFADLLDSHQQQDVVREIGQSFNQQKKTA